LGSEYAFTIFAFLLTLLLPTQSLAQAPKSKPKSSRSTASDLLRPPGSDSYSSIDWNALPPWKQTSFYGIRAKGQVFIYVVDCSGSMGDEARLVRAKQEIRRSVMDLRWPQKFYVIFYNDRPLTMPAGLPQSADLSNKLQMIDWMRSVDPGGETDPREAMAEAIAFKPDAIFLLSDGEFPDGTVEALAKKNAKKVPIHCIDLAGGAAGDQLKRIARDSGGQYASRPQ
jgi:uncharacterized protein with von Willebrand factor type A (vWA) domain